MHISVFFKILLVLSITRVVSQAPIERDVWQGVMLCTSIDSCQVQLISSQIFKLTLLEMSLYRILGLTEGFESDDASVRCYYRKLMVQIHPDRCS